MIGGGTMGAGIAQTLLEAADRVTVVEATPSLAEAAYGRIVEGLGRRFKRAHDPDADVAAALSRLELRVDLPPRVDPELVIEAVPESFGLKRRVLTEVDASYPELPLLASNTSSLSITGLAAALRAPERFLGMHFFNPVPISELVEIVAGTATSTAAIETAQAWAHSIDKHAIVVRDSPGFATSRLGLALGLEAIRMVEAGVATVEDIDTGMVLGYRHPIGPLRLTDLVGLDVRLGIAEHLAVTLGPRFEPPELLRTLVVEGKLGKKSGQGFYTWA
ncbi:3-hydroxyacyl-CoA dehydrogenase family protein [Candidatus Poriferisocius sp.]|uniref:3-hydroxyacyl-CoA dehydrogenase family protein n=1 Tax=Candidatus Poriferisocius sp. TaxID=3101276 RepID=UPI003B012060